MKSGSRTHRRPLPRPLATVLVLSSLVAGCGGTAPAPTEPAPAVTPAELQANAHVVLGLTTPPERTSTVIVGPLVDELGPEVRAAIHPRMVRHGKDLIDLYGAMQAGQRGEVARIAAAIADEPDIARSGPADSVNATVPAAFFERQAQLNASALALAKVARTPDGALAPAFEELAGACGGCHGPRDGD